MNKENILDFIKQRKEVFEKYFSRKEVKAGEFVFRENEKGESLFLLEKGRICINKSMGEGDESKTLAFISEGNFFGEIAVIDEVLRTASALACEDCALYEIKRKDFYELSEKYPKEGFYIFSAITKISLERLQHTSKELTLLYDISRLLTKHYSDEKDFLKEIVDQVAFYFEGDWNIESFFYNFYNDEYEKAGSNREFESAEKFPVPSQSGWLDENAYASVYFDKAKTQAYMIFDSRNNLSESEKNNWSVIFNTISFILASGLRNIAGLKEIALMNKLKDRKNFL
ncbi:MAG: cyclic nucleotide-binding domain-containing protein [Elusimicrobia bacterium]|nr:cyclic nucleotide-binding domain-containing protein [Elusimicrobiota bacterium]